MDAVQQAIAALHAGRIDEAERISRAVHAQHPNCWRNYPVLVECLIRGGEIAAADCLTSESLQSNPHQPDLLLSRAGTLMALERPDEAIERLDESLDLRINNPDAHRLLCSLLEERGDPTPRYPVTVITPSTGTQYLTQAIESVQAQTYPLVEHLIVADGPEYHDRVAAMLPGNPRHPVHLLPLPFNVGAQGYCGHRVYASVPFLVHSRYVAFLDEDNWYADDHLGSLMQLITARGGQWAYSLRRIVTAEGQFITNDDCESLGKWSTWDSTETHLVDVSCYLLRRDIAMSVSSLWHRRFRDERNPDFVICEKLLRDAPRVQTNGRYTLNYRTGSSQDSVSAEYFQRGNHIMEERAGGTFPWRSESEDRADTRDRRAAANAIENHTHSTAVELGNRPRCYLVFGTGRCGTAMLAQYFGGVPENRFEWRRNGDALIAHEPFDDDRKYWDCVTAAKDGGSTSLIERILLPALTAQCGCRLCLITDNKIGRWFFHEFEAHQFDVRLIYLHRSPDAVLTSLHKHSPQPTNLFWCHEPSDHDTMAELQDPHQFHIEETRLRWESLRQRLDPHQYLEVSFEKFLVDRSHRAEVEAFVGLQGLEHLVTRKTNASETAFAP